MPRRGKAPLNGCGCGIEPGIAGTGAAFYQAMQPTPQPSSSPASPTLKRPKPRAPSWSSPRHAMSTYIADEIRAYATIRDLALAEAERITNTLNLERARIANEFVENALQQTRTPHQ